MKEVYDTMKDSQEYTDGLDEKLLVNRIPSRIKRKYAKEAQYVKTFPKRLGQFDWKMYSEYIRILTIHIADWFQSKLKWTSVGLWLSCSRKLPGSIRMWYREKSFFRYRLAAMAVFHRPKFPNSQHPEEIQAWTCWRLVREFHGSCFWGARSLFFQLEHSESWEHEFWVVAPLFQKLFDSASYPSQI